MLLKNKLLSLANEHFFQNSFDIELQKPREQEKEKEKNSFFLKSSKHKKRKPEDFDNSKSKIRSGFYLLRQESCYDASTVIKKNPQIFKEKSMKNLKPVVFESSRDEYGKNNSRNSFIREENVKIYQKLLRISSDSKDSTHLPMKIKSRSNNEKEYIMVSEEEFYEINNIERENVGYLIHDYFDLNFDEKNLINKKKEMNKKAEKFHYDHRVRIHEFYDKNNSLKGSEMNQTNHKKANSLYSKPKSTISKDWFSKYNLNFIHIDLMVNEKQKRNIEEKLYNSYDDEKCLKKIMKIYKDNKSRFWIDNHHYNRMINKPYKEKIYKPCCKKTEYNGMECHQIKYSLMTFYKLMEEVIKDENVYGKLWILSYDYFFTSENFLFEIIKMFFIPTPVFLSKNEQKKFITYKIFPKQKKILSLLKLWVDYRPEDFLIYRNLGSLLNAFLLIIDLIYKENFNEEIKLIKEKRIRKSIISKNNLIKPKLKQNEQFLAIPAFVKDRKSHCHVLNLEFIPSMISHEMSVFFAIDSDSLVQQFCLIDYEMYKEVKPNDLATSFKSPKSSSTLNKIIQRYNFLTYYFILIIILQKEKNDKVKIILKFLDIAEKCVKFQNFQCLMTVCNALSHLLVLRFKKAWNSLPELSKKIDENIKDLVCFNKNYKKLRKTIKDSKPPFIPCLNIILRDINQLDGDNEWIFLNDKEFVNLRKMESLSEIVEQVINLQKTKYNFEKKVFFYEFFEKTFQKILEHYIKSNDIESIEEKLFEISKSIEINNKI